MKLVRQSAVLILSFVIVFLWQKTEALNFTVPFLGLLITIYLIVSTRKKGKAFLSLGGGPLGIFILTTIVLLLIFSTEGINSALFFLLYFLGFGIAFVFEPSMTFIFAVGVVLLFFPDTPDAINNLLKLGSILLISPLAYFFGKEYQKGEQQDEKIQSLKERTQEAADTISDDIEGVIKNEKQNLKDKDIEKLNEVLEETEDLRAESGNSI